MNETYVEWMIPNETTSEMERLRWIGQAIDLGQKANEQQMAWADIDKGRQTVIGYQENLMPSYRSKVKANIPKRQIREVISTTSDLRLLGGFKTFNRDYEQQAEVLNKMMIAWYWNTFADRKIRKSMQYAGVEGTGWARPLWKMDMWCEGRGDIDLEIYGPKDVSFIQLPRDGDIQRAYAVLIHQAVPVALMHAMYPEHATYIKPDRWEMNAIQKGLKKVQKFLSPVLNVTSKSSQQDIIFPVCDVYHIYVMDKTFNNTGHPVPMGKPGTSWYYEVPSWQTDIPAGRDRAGNPTYRKAEVKDCLYYPNRRFLVATPQHIFYDGPNPDLHGKVPLVRFVVDDWLDEIMGFPLTHDTYTMSETHTNIMRGMADRLEVKAQPPLAYDKNTVAKSVMEKLDTRRPNQKIGIDMQAGEAPKPLLDRSYFSVDADEFTFLQLLEDQMGKQLALKDMLAMAKAKLNVGSDAMERLIESSGPVVKDICRNMEQPVAQLADLVKALMFQYYTVSRRVQILGEDGLNEEDFDYDPNSMIPSHSPDEFAAAGKNFDGTQKMPAQESRYTQLERARMYCDNFYYHQTPNSLHQQQQMARKLLFVQLASKGIVPIDPWTLAEVCDVPNYGPAPKGTTTVFERWMAWHDIQKEMAQEMAGGAQPGTRGPQGGQRGTGGRSPSGNAPPRVISKDGGTRSTIAESR
jgi:hypothetical protein